MGLKFYPTPPAGNFAKQGIFFSKQQLQTALTRTEFPANN